VLLLAAIVHRTGVVAGLRDAETVSSGDRDAVDSADSKSKENSVVNLRHLNLPQPNLNDLLEYSPFGVSPRTAAAIEDTIGTSTTVDGESGAADSDAADSDGTPKVARRLKAVYQSQNGPVALVDSKLVRVGDLLEDGSLVLEIHPRHLVLTAPTRVPRMAVKE
jgi:hypothetical protein